MHREETFRAKPHQGFKDVRQNFFAGILILWRRSFVVGDEIKIREFEGTVEDITTRSTRVKTYDGERAVLPNGDVYMNAILVRSAYENRRVRLTVGIGYKDSIESARKVIHEVLQKMEGVLKDPGPRSDGSLEPVGTSTIECYGRDYPYDPPPDPGPCDCPPDRPCLPCDPIIQ